MDPDAGGRSPGSTIAASEVDENMTNPSSPVRADPRTSLQHVLGDPESRQSSPPPGGHGDFTEDEELVVKPQPKTKGVGKGRGGKHGVAHGGERASGNSSVFTGNKIKHLKKEDGEPLWRKDIQYDFLKLVFENDQAVFTNSYEPETMSKQTFANLYIDAMARSSKTSKILRDKLLSEHEPAKNMAMVCLLVNLGRMNTTLNCKLFIPLCSSFF
jgi:Ino eighty subunit 1